MQLPVISSAACTDKNAHAADEIWSTQHYTTPAFTAPLAIPTQRVRSRARATSSLPPITSPRGLSLIARVSFPHLCAYSHASLAPPVVAAARRPTTPDRTTTSTSASCCRHRHSSWSLDRYFVVLFLPCLKSVSLSCHACVRCATGNVAASGSPQPRPTALAQVSSAPPLAAAPLLPGHKLRHHLRVARLPYVAYPRSHQLKINI
mmetsp:Transcript_74022/g.211354  ORF Transcript_74022/g.211354 Transcript_74022/m.211354 type:complete len:205 (+) Transcript_74022:208-822(+)